MEEKLVTIATYSYIRAEILKSKLEANGIECYLRNVNLLQPDVAKGVKVMVSSHDVEKAMPILKDVDDQVLEEEEEVEENEEKEEKSNNIVTIATMNFTRAQILKSRLEVEGIECFLKNVNLIQPDVAGGVKVRVHESDVDKALPIVIQLNKEYEDKPEIEEKPEKLKDIKKILVPVDFSDYSVRAAKYAIKIAQKYNSEIQLFHSYYNPAIYAEPFTEGYAYQLNISKYLRDIETEAEENLTKFANSLKKHLEEEEIKGVSIYKTLVCGNADREIINMSKIYSPDLIIIGMKGEAGSPNEIIGSIANKVIRNTDMPVLAIPEETKYKSIDQIKNILYATDLDKSDFISIKKLLGIVAYLYPKIYCVHLSESKDDPWSKAKLQNLNEHILKRYPQYNVECTLIECKDKEEGIEDFVQKNDIGLITINSHKRNIFRRLFNPSFTKKMVFHANTPLLVFHA